MIKIFLIYRRVRVTVAIRVERWEDVPFVRFGESPNVGLLTGQQFVQYVQNGGRSDPFPSVDSSLEEDTRLVAAERQFHTFDLTAFVSLSTNDYLDLARVSLGQAVQVRVDLLQFVVVPQVKSGKRLDRWFFAVDQSLNVSDVSLVSDFEFLHRLNELRFFVWGNHHVGEIVDGAGLFPEGVL